MQGTSRENAIHVVNDPIVRFIDLVSSSDDDDSDGESAVISQELVNGTTRLDIVFSDDNDVNDTDFMDVVADTPKASELASFDSSSSESESDDDALPPRGFTVTTHGGAVRRQSDMRRIQDPESYFSASFSLFKDKFEASVDDYKSISKHERRAEADFIRTHKHGLSLLVGRNSIWIHNTERKQDWERAIHKLETIKGMRALLLRLSKAMSGPGFRDEYAQMKTVFATSIHPESSL